jgi:hypothetical protein
MESKEIWAFVNWGVLLVVILAAVWMIWGFPQGEGEGEEGVEEIVADQQCVDVEDIEKIEYGACYDASSEMIFLRIDRGNANYQINKATVSFVGLVSQSYDFVDVPVGGESGAYKFSSKKNPGSISVRLDVVRSSSEWFCGGKNVFVDYCPTGTGGAGVDVSISSVGGVSISDFVEIEDLTDFTDAGSDIVVTDLADRERIWESKCKSNWDCGEYEACEDGVQRRNCKDTEGCLIPTNSPARTQTCDRTCVEDWECEWSACENGVSVPQCNDVNKCGTSYNIPKELSCDEGKECIPDVACDAWTSCNVDYNFLDLIESSGISQLTGSKTRLCIDKEDCVSALKEEQVCSVDVDIYTKKFDRCGEEYIGVYSILDDSTLAILKEGSGDNPYLNIYFDDQESVYCDYCFDGVMNGDESDIDCGGSCRKCSVEIYYEEKHWWDFFFNW